MASAPLNCTYTSPDEFNLILGLSFNLISSELSSGSQYSASVSNTPWMSISWADDSYEPAPGPIVSFFAAKYSQSYVYTDRNTTVPAKKPVMTECSVY